MKLLHIGKRGNVERFSCISDIQGDIEIIDMPVGLPDENYLAMATDADFVVADAMARISGNLIKGMPNLKMIHSEGVGYNFFDLDAANEQQVFVCNCKGMNAMAVAEQALLLMLGMLRDVVNCDEAVRAGNQIEKKEGYMTSGNLLELSDCRVGLLGFGDISKCLAELLKVFNVEVFYYDKYRSAEDIELRYNVTYMKLDDLLASCNIISLHLPVTKETENMVNDEFFGKLQQGSYFVNTARGELVDSAALIKAIKSGKLAMAALDTVAGEPVRTNNIILNQDKEVLDKLLFSPHIGGITCSSFRRGYSMIWNNIRKIIDGERPDRIVNRI